MSSFINLDNFNGAPFQLFENNNVVNKKSSNMTGRLSENRVSELYFSQSNIDFLQDAMIEAIYKLTNGVRIAKQSEDELMIIMRGIYLQFSKNLNTNIDKQVYELNKKVLKYSIKNVHENIKQYQGYIHDITKERDVMEMPQNVDIKGEKTLMPRHFI